MTRALPATFGELPKALCLRLQNAERVILIANNPAISPADLAGLNLKNNDVLVSFNTCAKAALLSGDWTNVLVHGFNEPDRYFFGLPCQPVVQQLIDRPGNKGFTLLMGCTGEMSAIPGVGLLWARFPLPVVQGYPQYRPDGKPFAGPSTGFSTMLVFDWLRREAGYPYQLLTVGFSNEAGKLWRGHAWEYERDWLQHAQITRVPLQRKFWWQRLFKRT
jgi:hypothetical protein